MPFIPARPAFPGEFAQDGTIFDHKPWVHLAGCKGERTEGQRARPSIADWIAAWMQRAENRRSLRTRPVPVQRRCSRVDWLLS
jgi:hypothetical protein